MEILLITLVKEEWGNPLFRVVYVILVNTFIHLNRISLEEMNREEEGYYEQSD